jgi:transcriptional regulator with XRE-family HTH domain
MRTPTVIDRSGCPARKHGKYWTYNHQCRCPDTLRDKSTRQSRYATRTQPPGYHDATGTRRRLQALAVEGWTMIRLAELTGLSERALRAAVNTNTRVLATTARYVAKVYDQYAGHDGGNQAAANRALARGWHDSYCWPDNIIDNPQAKPWFGEDDADGYERRTAVAHLTAAGLSARQIGERLGIEPRSVTRHRAAIRQAETNQAAA